MGYATGERDFVVFDGDFGLGMSKIREKITAINSSFFPFHFHSLFVLSFKFSFSNIDSSNLRRMSVKDLKMSFPFLLSEMSMVTSSDERKG